jgi:hypothetical protein
MAGAHRGRRIRGRRVRSDEGRVGATSNRAIHPPQLGTRSPLAPVLWCRFTRSHNTCRRCYPVLGSGVRGTLTVADRGLANFGELRQGEVRRTPQWRTAEARLLRVGRITLTWADGARDLPTPPGCPWSAPAKCGVPPAPHPHGIRSAKPAHNPGVRSRTSSRTNRSEEPHRAA